MKALENYKSVREMSSIKILFSFARFYKTSFTSLDTFSRNEISYSALYYAHDVFKTSVEIWGIKRSS